MQCVENCSDPDPRRHVLYEQPVWQTLQMFRTSPSSTFSSLTNRTSRRDVLLVTPHVCPCATFHFLTTQGFLPVIYAWLRTRARRHTPSLQFQPDLEHDHHVHKLDHLTGSKVLLLWIPALCDLTGTTVCPQPPQILLSHFLS